ncbi:hypothetical protein [Paenibacillus sp. AR247]|uniref:hypothetical protein n=1 Tax=Paenibacillus sp. AR247 TaxID=1631599 RepID=UPI000CF946D6|nr:hypothetical protein [Paenibacillus sp. AR247]PQP89513.1 hypothetical protein CPT76_15785 [Paenibacillus sp. AR247]
MKINSAATGDMFTFISSQAQEQPLASHSGRVLCRYAYGRAMETLLQGENGQDFVGVQTYGDVCNFVLCDGVSMSYQGDFAARFLGNTLLDWLDHTRDWSSAGFTEFMTSITESASAQLRRLAPPGGVPSLLREVLEDKQRMGSQSMYICGRIELPISRKKQGRLWTDGLADLDPIHQVLPDELIQILLDAPHTEGLQDDAAFLELQWS